MLFFVVHHLLPLSGVAFVLVQFVLPFARKVAHLRQRTFDQLGAARHVEPAVGSIPQAALAAIHESGDQLVGFHHLGILTTQPSRGLFAFTGLWVDDETRSTLAQVMFIQTKFSSRPVVRLAVQCWCGDPAQPRMLVLGNRASFGLTSGTPPWVTSFTFPGAAPAALADLHRRLALTVTSPRLPVASLGTAVAALDCLTARQHEWRLETGRMVVGQDGHLRLSWRQRLWWAARTDPFLTPYLTKGQTQRGQRAAASWPQRASSAAGQQVSGW